jgi:hypothetical protein
MTTEPSVLTTSVVGSYAWPGWLRAALELARAVNTALMIRVRLLAKRTGRHRGRQRL